MRCAHEATGSGEIVVGLENRQGWERPLDWATDQALLERRPLHLVHAVEASEELWHDVGGRESRIGVPDHTAPTQLLLDQARIRALTRAPELTVRETLANGGPRDVLSAMADGEHLLVLGSRDRGALRSRLLGSVGASVSRRPPCAVVIVHADHPGRIHRGVLVGVDDSGAAQPALRFAFEQASLHDWPLTVVHVAPAPVPGDRGERERERLHLATVLAGEAENFPDVHVTTTIDHGDPADRLLRAGEAMNLIVVGAHHGPAITDVLLGSVAIPVVERARGAVAVVPPGAP